MFFSKKDKKEKPFNWRQIVKHKAQEWLTATGFWDKKIARMPLSQAWQQRIDDVKSSTDNVFLPRHEAAGKIQNGIQTMHNGLKIHLGSYYGAPIARMLLENKGVHEPQEERVFAAVLAALPTQSVIVELGAYWGFYSLWLHQKMASARCFLVEPNPAHLIFGQRNFKLNGAKGQFFSYGIGQKTDISNNTISVDDFIAQQNIDFVHILHADIQGAEYDLLLGAEWAFTAQKIGYIFISTHSNALHYQCLDFLIQQKFIIIANANLDETYSFDGLIVGRSPHFFGIDEVKISLK